MKLDGPKAFYNLDISRSALQAQRRRMDAISENLANLSTTRGANGGPYRPKTVSMQEGDLAAEWVKVEGEQPKRIWTTHPQHLGSDTVEGDSSELSGVRAEVSISNRPPRMEYDPDHPDANEEGYVAYPDINVVEEMTHLIAASRAYEANITALAAAKDMATRALDI